MNIIVRTFHGRIIARPDTTREKDNDNFYVPDFVDVIDFAPVLFARICKPGKYIGEKFAYRYHDSFGKGLLLYPKCLDQKEEGDGEEFAESLCLDHTSYLPVALKPASELTKEDRYSIEKAVVLVSTRCLLRTGDFVAIETDKRKELCRRKSAEKTGGVVHLENFDIIY